jgi:hypothetical protein
MPRGIKNTSASSDALFQQLKEAIRREVRDEIIASLSGGPSKAATPSASADAETTPPAKKGRRKMSAAARAKIAAAQKARWAKQKAPKA